MILATFRLFMPPPDKEILYLSKYPTSKLYRDTSGFYTHNNLVLETADGTIFQFDGCKVCIVKKEGKKEHRTWYTCSWALAETLYRKNDAQNRAVQREKEERELALRRAVQIEARAKAVQVVDEVMKKVIKTH